MNIVKPIKWILNTIHDFRYPISIGSLTAWIGVCISHQVSGFLYPQEWIMPICVNLIALIGWTIEFIETIKSVNKTEE